MPIEEQLARDVSRLASRVVTDALKPSQSVAVAATDTPKFHKENSVVGVELQDYTNREPSDDGLYVKVTTHRERIELIEQPPTEEELAEQKAQQKFRTKLAVGFGGGLLVVLGLFALADTRKVKARAELETSE